MENKEEKKVEEKKQETEGKVEIKESYHVFGTDIEIKDADLIEFHKERFRTFTVIDNLVGTFNHKGLYIISVDVKRDLVNMPKEIEDMGEDFYFASNIYMKKYFYYKVEIAKIENGKAKASLYLMEKATHVLDDGYLTTHVADFVDTYDLNFRLKVREKFNLQTVKVPVSDLNVPNLAIVMQDNYDLLHVFGDLYDISSQIYVIQMLKILEAYGAKGKEVIELFETLKKESKEDLAKPETKNMVLKILLDKAIDKKGGFEKIGENKPELKPAVIKAVKENTKSTQEIETVKTGKGPVEIQNNPGSGKGAAKKPASAAKKPDKKKAAAKKPNKKKADKKKDAKGGAKKADPNDYLWKNFYETITSIFHEKPSEEKEKSEPAPTIRTIEKPNSVKEDKIEQPVKIPTPVKEEKPTRQVEDDDMDFDMTFTAKVNIDQNLNEVATGRVNITTKDEMQPINNIVVEERLVIIESAEEREQE